MEKNSAANLLTSIDSLFTTQQERDLATQPRVEEGCKHPAIMKSVAAAEKKLKKYF